jgi:hypothetical protein
MCLYVTVHVPAATRQALESIAAGLGTQAPLDVAVFVPGPGELELTISERRGPGGDGCACSLLADSADWHAATWAMEPPARAKLAKTIALLAERVPRPFTIEATWDGDLVERDHDVAADDVVRLAAAGELGTRDRYTVSG